MKSVPVLMYHALEGGQAPVGRGNSGEQIYVVDVKKFREQMRYLYAEGYKTVFSDEVASTRDLSDKSVVITFDDGHASNYSLALPILAEFGFKAEFFITTDWIGEPDFMNMSQIQSLSSLGMRIGSHCKTHRYLDELTEDQIEEELRCSRDKLRQIVGRSIDSISVPGGRLNQYVKQCAMEAGYRNIFTSEEDVYCPERGKISIPRLPLLRTTSMEEFKSLVNQNELSHLKRKARYKMLACAKAVLGNNVYMKIRNALLGFARVSP